MFGLLGCWGQNAFAEDFFAVRNQNALLRGFYVPLPIDTALAAPTAVSATWLVTNTINVERRPHERLLVDGESSVVDLSVDHALAPSWRYRLSLPIIHDGGGALDSTIDGWHRAFGLSRSFRPYYPKNQFRYFYDGKSSFDVSRPGTTMGDVAADFGWYALDDGHRVFSLWGGFKAPTGSLAGLASDGAWDGALWVHAAIGGGGWNMGLEAGLSQPFGDEVFAGAAHRTVAFARLAATRTVGSVWSVRGQLDGQSGRLAGTRLRFLGPSLQMSLGADRHLGKKWRLQLGFSEDVAVYTAPDITFFLGIRR